MMHLTEQQLDFFDTFGYLALPGLMADCIDEITEAFEQVWSERGGGHHGKAHDGKERSCIVPFIDQHERLCALLDDPRIEGLLASPVFIFRTRLPLSFTCLLWVVQISYRCFEACFETLKGWRNLSFV